jgi:hypothetical protein
MTQAGGRAPSGMVVGSVIALIFGTVFVEVNCGGLPGSWPLAVRIAGVVVAVGLLVAVLRTARGGAAGGVPGGGFADRRYWNIVGVEGLALFGGLVVINAVFDRPEFAVPWIALVVGVHFVVLGKAWRLDLFTWLGVVQTLLGLAGFVLAGAGASTTTVEVVAGVLSGVALFATVAAAVFRARPATVRS